MSLADELLADLDDGNEEMEGIENDEQNEDGIDEVTEDPFMNLGAYDRITEVAKLTQSKGYILHNYDMLFERLNFSGIRN